MSTILQNATIDYVLSTQCLLIVDITLKEK